MTKQKTLKMTSGYEERPAFLLALGDVAETQIGNNSEKLDEALLWAEQNEPTDNFDQLTQLIENSWNQK